MTFSEEAIIFVDTEDNNREYNCMDLQARMNIDPDMCEVRRVEISGLDAVANCCTASNFSTLVQGNTPVTIEIFSKNSTQLGMKTFENIKFVILNFL